MHASDLTAIEARELLRNGQLSSVELVEACEVRIDQVDPSLNAMVTRSTDRALVEAAAADVAQANGIPGGPLRGLPVAIKDLQPTEGVRTTFGSKDFANNVPDQDCGIVARVRAAGGIVTGKTNIPEFSIGANTVNPLFGGTGNPFDPDLTCGGSSGGSAVAVATGMAPLATGSDHGGSLRIPACYCGVVGHRATPGIVPNEERSMTQNFYSVQGPVARNVRDTALLLSVVASRTLLPAGPNRDAMMFPFDSTVFESLESIDLNEVTIGVSTDLGGVLVSKTIRESFEHRLGRLEALGLRLVEVPVDLTRAPDVDWRLRSDVFVTQWHDQASGWSPDFNPNIQQSYAAALDMQMEDIAVARKVQAELLDQFQRHFEGPGRTGVDVLLCPGVSIPPFPWIQRNPEQIDGKPVENYMAWLALTASLTVVGHPVTAIPCGRDSTGMPFGLQIVGPMYGDHRSLSIAAALEDLFETQDDLARPVPILPPR